MDERMRVTQFTLVNPTEGGAAPELYFEALCSMTIVGVSAAPHTDDAGATIDIADDGTDVIAAVDASDADVPGTWQAKGYGGTEDPVNIDKDSLVKINQNNGANGTAFNVVIWWLQGSDWK